MIAGNLARDANRRYARVLRATSRAPSLGDGLLQPVDLAVALAHLVRARRPRLRDQHLGLGGLFPELVDAGLRGLELRPLRGLGGVADPNFALRVGVPLAQLLDVVGLAKGLGAESAEGRREGLAVFGVALLRGGGISFSPLSFRSLLGCEMARSDLRRVAG